MNCFFTDSVFINIERTRKQIACAQLKKLSGNGKLAEMFLLF